MTARPRRYFVDTADGYVHVQDCGEGDRVIAFVSITSFGGVLLDGVLPRLAEKGYRALAFDLMGYGVSDKRRDTWLIADFADNLAEAVTLSGARPAGYVVGHFAALVGVEVAARLPQGLRGLVLDGAPLIDTERQRNFDPLALPAPIDWTEDGAHAVAFWKRAYGLLHALNPELTLAAQPPAKLREAYLAYLSVACFEPGTAAAYHLFDARARMRDIEVPTLVLCADTDWNRPHYQAWVDGVPNSRGCRFHGVHPLHQLERPDRAEEYVRVVDEFFAPLL